MTWPLFLIFVVMVIALFFVLSVGMPRFFSWFKNLFLQNSLVSPNPKLPTLRVRRKSILWLVLLSVLGSVSFSPRAQAACLFYGNIFANYTDCDAIQFQQSAPEYSVPTTTFTWVNPSSSYFLTLASTTKKVSDLSSDLQITNIIGMTIAAILLIDLCRRIVLPKRW